MELSAWPGSSLDAEKTSSARIKAIQADLASKDIEISALGYYPNYLDRNEAEAGEARRYFLKVLDLAQTDGHRRRGNIRRAPPVEVGRGNIAPFKEVFSRFCDEAEKRNIKIAIENCPMVDVQSMEGTNIAFSPEVWDAMFEAVPLEGARAGDRSLAHGLARDRLCEGGPRLRRAHLSTRMPRTWRSSARPWTDGHLRTGLRQAQGFGHGWWRARTPGWGEVDWPAFITALIEVGYKGNIDIEHEDDVFAAASSGG